ncbi:MAG: hypothetical protein IJZ53_06320 [Tyzzerella sp.]|nr:hypothetical protein [Tyzzerella sp.]
MKRFVSILLAAVLVGTTIVGCGKEEESKAGDEKVKIVDQDVTLTEKDDSIVMENGNVSVTISKKNGNITSVLHVSKEAELIDGDGANFTLTLDPTTSDVFRANHGAESAIAISNRDYAPTVELVKDKDESSILLTYDLGYTYDSKEVTGIQVVNTISLSRKATHFTSDYTINNQATSDCVVVNLTGTQMSGLKNPEKSKAWSLFYPYKEGKLYEDIISRINEGVGVGTKMVAAYPSPMSMQLLQVYNNEMSFDYSVLDDAGAYKEFNFGKFNSKGEYDENREVGYQISMSCTQFPFVKNGESAELSTYRVGVGGGEWYDGADRYREFLVSSGMYKEKKGLASEWSGMSTLISQGNTGSVFATYESSPIATANYSDWISGADAYGIDTLCAIGWNEGGFDHNYPDYEFSEAQGGESAFASMVEKLHTNGDNIICYINAHIADEYSNFAKETSTVNASLTKLYSSAIKKAGFVYGETASADYEKYMYYESYAGGLSAYAMSPASEEFQNAIISAVTRLAEKGVDGIWFDQLMEMPAYLDYDASHGAKNPATAYSEGYAKMLSKCVEIMEQANGGESLFVCEGVCDAYLKYIDCCGMMWGRKLGSKDTTNMNDEVEWAAKITRYTLPNMMLGLEGVGTTQGSQNEFARAFVFGEPLLASNYQDSITKITSIYSNAKEIYHEGRYLDEKGLRVSNEDIIAGLIKGTDGSYGLQVYNNSKNDLENVKVILDLEQLQDADCKVKSVINLLTGEEVSLKGDNTFTLSIKGEMIAAYKITIE